jgi:hypothetical protein
LPKVFHGASSQTWPLLLCVRGYLPACQRPEAGLFFLSQGPPIGKAIFGLGVKSTFGRWQRVCHWAIMLVTWRICQVVSRAANGLGGGVCHRILKRKNSGAASLSCAGGLSVEMRIFRQLEFFFQGIQGKGFE